MAGPLLRLDIERVAEAADVVAQVGIQGRVLAAEAMVPNAAIRNLIREDKVHQIYSQMQIGQAKFGMQTMNQALCEHFLAQRITLDDALARSSDADELKTMIGQGGRPTMNHGSRAR